MRFRSWNLQLRLAAIACGLAVAAAGVTIVTLQWQSGETIERLRLAQLQAADDHEAGELLRAWATDENVAFLIARLNDNRPAVATAAGDVLHERLTAWQRLRSQDSLPLVADLARRLATADERCSPAGRSAARSLAQRILLWPLDERKLDSAKLLADCELVLRDAAQRREHDLLLAVAIDPSPADAAMMLARRSDSTTGDGDVAIAPLLPGGGLPWSTIELPAREPAATNADDTPTAAVPEPLFDPPGEIYAPLATPLDLLDDKDHADDRTASQDNVDGGSLRRTDGRQQFADRSLQAADEWSLMKRLHAPGEAAEAEAELRRRGHSARTLALARRLTDADSSVRAELVEMLPQLDGIDPQPWLLQLSRDADPEVRRAAITVLASSNDASVTQWLEELRDDEDDPRVGAMIDNLLRRRR